MSILFRPAPNEVFTPRNANVNERMYVDRPHLQERLQRAVNGSQHIVVFGDSGCGKTWLYQRYLKRQKIPFRVVDLSTAVGRGLDHAFRDALTDGFGWAPVHKLESHTGGAKAVIEAHRKVEQQYSFNDVSAFDKIVTELSGGNNKPKFLVFDNLEQISNHKDLLAEIARLIIRLDNPRFSLSGVRFLLVGVVSDIKDLISSHDHAGTIVNRLVEVPEVCNLSYQEASDLIVKGFKQLKIELKDKSRVVNLVSHLTFANPQQIHSFCYQIACEAEKNDWVVDDEQIKSAFSCWVQESLGQHKAFVETRLNKKETRVQRRNQVLLSIASANSYEFSASEVEALVSFNFPESSNANGLGCYQILRSLCDGKNPLLVHMPATGQFRFTHPKIRLAIRALLTRGDDGVVGRLKDILNLELKLH